MCSDVGTNIPKSKIFIFENYWTEHPSFFDTVSTHWNNSPVYANAAKNLTSKLKHVRTGLRKWSKNFSKLNKLIYNSNWVLLLLDGLEDQRPLSWLETAFGGLVKSHLASLLESKRAYWKQRNTVNRIKYGDECTKYFHSMATVSYRRNLIAQIQDDYEVCLIHHEDKANHLWCSFKNRMGLSNNVTMEFDLRSLVPVFAEADLDSLATPFLASEIESTIKLMPADKAPGPNGFNGGLH